METTGIFFNESAFPFSEILHHGLVFKVDLDPQRTGHSVVCEGDRPVTEFTDKLTTLQPLSHPPFQMLIFQLFFACLNSKSFLGSKLNMSLLLIAHILLSKNITSSFSPELLHNFLPLNSSVALPPLYAHAFIRCKLILRQ